MQAQAPQTTFIAERQLDRVPVDVVLTPNAKLAVVRCLDASPASPSDELAVIDTATGSVLPKSSCNLSAGLGLAPNPSDAVVATNGRAILVGSRDTDTTAGDDTTYIDVLAFDMNSTPPGVTCLAHHELGTPASFNLRAGYVSDVAVTPDETFAVVNSQNWIHVVDLATGQIAEAFNIGSAPYAGPCSPGFQADSVAVTNARAVVTTTRLAPLSVAWVYVIDLLSSQDPAVILEHQLSPDSTERDFDPHDVAITPDGMLAVVSASSVVGLYDIDQGAFLARDVGPFQTRLRFYRELADSVEVTNTRAVVTAYEYNDALPPNQWWRWVVDVYQIGHAPPALTSLWSYRAITYYGTNPPYNADWPHDLEIDSNGEKAVVRTSYYDLVLSDLAAPGPGDLYAFHRGYGPHWDYIPGGGTFVSDSVKIAAPFYEQVLPGQGSGLRHYAITIGGEYLNPPGSVIGGRVDVLEIGAVPPTLAASFSIADPNNPPVLNVMPSDVQLGLGRQFVVRTSALPDDPPPSNPTIPGRDFVRYTLNPLAEVARLGGSGTVFAVDSLEIARTLAASVSEVLAVPRGFVHLVLLN